MMKLALLIIVLFCLAGCNDFLAESSQDEVRPSTVEDMEQMLLGNAYMDDKDILNVTDIFTDDIKCNGLTDVMFREDFVTRKSKYLWNPRMFVEEEGGTHPAFWEYPYQGILGCNIVLDCLDKMYGDNRLRNSLKGEALVLRSFYYFMLVNFFGVPYNQGNPGTDLGVPLKLDMTVTGEYFKRNTVAEVYSRIETDLLEGNRLLKTYDFNRNVFRISHLAAKAFLSRMYLYMEDWDKALAYADSVLMEKPKLLNLSVLPFNRYDNVSGVYDVTTPDEIIWVRAYPKNWNNSSGNLLPFTLSDEILNMYGADGKQYLYTPEETLDLRVEFYCCWGTDRAAIFSGKGMFYCCLPTKYDKGEKRYDGVRVAEMYLNRIEVYIRKFMRDGDVKYRTMALNDLNYLRQNRLNNKIEYVPVNIEDAAELFAFYKNERRLELCGETNNRWCDLRRYGETVTHLFWVNPLDAREEYKKDMSRFVLPIPENILEANPSLRQN